MKHFLLSLLLIPFIIFFVLPEKVHAAYCSGSTFCGGSMWSCTGSGQDCANGCRAGICPPGAGSCRGYPYCHNAGGCGSAPGCKALTCSASCERDCGSTCKCVAQSDNCSQVCQGLTCYDDCNRPHTGTKKKDCSKSWQYCPGVQYNDPNGCGKCTGTKNPGPATCGACSVTCGGGTQSCYDLCSSWNQACNTQACIPTCTLDLLPGTASISQGDPLSLTATVTNIQYGPVTSVNFSSNNASVVSVSPASDTTVTYQTVATGVSQGSAVVTAQAIIGGSAVCSDTSTVSVLPAGPWWQVWDGDVMTNGDLQSKVPSGKLFDLVGPGTFPGVPAFGGSTNLVNSRVSSRGWLANSSHVIRNNKVYNYAFFSKLIPGDTVVTNVPSNSTPGNYFAAGGTLSYGYYWYKYDGSQTGLDLTISSPISLPDGRKVILLVDSVDLYIGGSINYTSGRSFFMAMVGKNLSGQKGNIFVDPLVGGSPTADLQGYFLSDGTFSTGAGTTSLHLKGSLAAYKGVSLQRDLGAGLNGTTPSEVFEYSPADSFLYPPKLSIYRMKWKEVAP